MSDDYIEMFKVNGGPSSDELVKAEANLHSAVYSAVRIVFKEGGNLIEVVVTGVERDQANANGWIIRGAFAQEKLKIKYTSGQGGVAYRMKGRWRTSG